MNRLDLLNNQFKAQEAASEFEYITQAPTDAILGLSIGYKNDKNPNKVNLGIGAYRSSDGKPFVFPVIRAAEKKITENHSLDKEYLPIDGDQVFNKGARGVLFGFDHPDVTSGRVTTCQTLSGTGALRVIADFLMQHRPAPIYISSPTWGNHKGVFTKSGLTIRNYRYFDKKTKGLDFEGMIEDLQNATPGSTVLLHTCAHNPTGVDPTLDQWKRIYQVVKTNNLFPFFDTAY